MAIYNLHIKSSPLTFRYQIDMPFFGVLFAPHYGQSYYEIFNLGNTDGIVQVSAPHNKFALRNHFTIDFPLGKITLRAGYLCSLYRKNINGIQSHIRSNSFTLGIVREIYSFNRKKRKTNVFKSALYD